MKIMIGNDRNISSGGAQLKFFDEKQNMWYKQDYLGTEGLSEYAVSVLLAGSDISYVEYMPCRFMLGQKSVTGCKSRHFLQPGEQLISTHKLLKIHYGIDIEKLIVPMDTEDKIQTYVNKVIETTGYEYFGNYLTKILQLDAITKNDDRHFNNISFILDQNGNYRPAPIFDNGGAFLSDQYTYGEDLSYDDVLIQMDRVVAKPFSRYFDEQLDACEKLYPANLGLNFNNILDKDMLSNYYKKSDINKVKIILEQSRRKYKYLDKSRQIDFRKEEINSDRE